MGPQDFHLTHSTLSWLCLLSLPPRGRAPWSPHQCALMTHLPSAEAAHMQFSRTSHFPTHTHPSGKKRGHEPAHSCPLPGGALLFGERLPHFLLPSSTLYCLPLADRQASRQAKCEKVLLPGRVQRRKSVTEANLTRPSGRLPGSLAEPQGLKTQTLSHTSLPRGASKSLHSKSTWLRCVFLKRLIHGIPGSL